MKTEQGIIARLTAIREECVSMSDTIFGSLSKNRNTYIRKDGSKYESPIHYTLKIPTNGSKAFEKRIPEDSVDYIKECIENGRKYNKLEREYRYLVSQLALLKKSSNTASVTKA